MWLMCEWGFLFLEHVLCPGRGAECRTHMLSLCPPTPFRLHLGHPFSARLGHQPLTHPPRGDRASLPDRWVSSPRSQSSHFRGLSPSCPLEARPPPQLMTHAWVFLAFPVSWDAPACVAPGLATPSLSQTDFLRRLLAHEHDWPPHRCPCSSRSLCDSQVQALRPSCRQTVVVSAC